MKKVILITGAMLLLAACSAGKPEQKAGDEAGYANSAPPPPPAGEAGGEPDAGGQAGAVQVEHRLIKNGEVYFKTRSLTETKKAIQAALTAAKGYIARENAYDYSDNPSEELTVRVPAASFDAFLAAVLQGAVEVDSKKIDIEDVTEQFIDTEARLKNKRQLEAKYQELLARATNMEDILKIEKEISLIRQEVEAAEGQLNYLRNQVSYSTLKLTYYEKRSSGFDFGGKLGSAFKNGFTGFLWFMIGMVSLWPLWLCVGLTWWLIISLVRRRKKRKAA